jgi:hypothetical protein
LSQPAIKWALDKAKKIENTENGVTTTHYIFQGKLPPQQAQQIKSYLNDNTNYVDGKAVVLLVNTDSESDSVTVGHGKNTGDSNQFKIQRTILKYTLTPESKTKQESPPKTALKHIVIQQTYTVDGKTEQYAVKADVAVKLANDRLTELQKLRACINA